MRTFRYDNCDTIKVHYELNLTVKQSSLLCYAVENFLKSKEENFRELPSEFLKSDIDELKLIVQMLNEE